MSKLDITITYLQMMSPPTTAPKPMPPGAMVMQAIKPTVSFYRYLYNTVGQDWLWGDRRKWSDAELAAEVQHPLVEVQVLYYEGVPAGYVELDRRQPSEVELAYFGLMPEFIGRGLGGFMLNWTIHRAWSYLPRRVWLHTCTLDHPQALAVYQKAGFEIYQCEQKFEDDPRDLGLM